LAGSGSCDSGSSVEWISPQLNDWLPLKEWSLASKGKNKAGRFTPISANE
jgi:hypothetical protein